MSRSHSGWSGVREGVWCEMGMEVGGQEGSGGLWTLAGGGIGRRDNGDVIPSGSDIM